MKTMLMPPPAGGLAEGESALDRFTLDLTHSARIGKLDPVIGGEGGWPASVRLTSSQVTGTRANPGALDEREGGRRGALWQA